MQTQKRYHDELKELMDNHVHLVYALSRNFPKEELYGVTSQLRRAALSVILNYIEGYARIGEPTYKHFLKNILRLPKRIQLLAGVCFR